MRTLGRYELLAPIGRGGMAVVWAARLRGTHGFSKIVAIKTILPAMSADPRFEAMFLAEAQMASGIKHPNVCEILDLGEDRGTLYLVMESIDGEPLSRLEDACRERGRRVSPGIAARMIAQAARGLHAAHDLKTETGEPSAVIHRDVSPQNILVTCDGILKIVDFGVAKAAVSGTPATAAGVIKGKVAYLAPEQIDGRDIDSRVDIFALGIVLHELVGGAHPFEGMTDLTTLLSIASPDPAPPLPGDEASYPSALRAIVARALEKDRTKRYASMRELALELEEVADDLEATADDVGAFVTEILGEERSQRRREMHEAARAADATRARVASAATPAPAAPEQPAEPAKAAPTEASPASRARPGASRNILLAAVLVVGIAGITMGALGLRALQGKPRAADSVITPLPSTSVTSAALAQAGTTTTPSTIAATAVPAASEPPPPEPRLALASAAASAPAVAAARSPGIRAAARPAPSSAASGRTAVPAGSSSGTPKRGPLDGWD